ncbi:MAG: hypothetical protein J6V98_04575 [Bacteroidales bacterium]|nr:hypothetical protein [Bacteroidales bacterium]
MNRTSRIICGIAFLAFGIGWMLELSNVIDINLDGWWTLFIIIPCFASLFGNKSKSGPLIGLGVGILLLLATRDIVPWFDFWKYVVCLVAVVWGLSLIFGQKNGCSRKQSDRKTVDELKQINQDGRQIRQINVSFGKHLYEFSGQRFEGANVETSFGFTSLDLRGADMLDGAIVDVECSFGGMEIRVDKNICVKCAVESAFAGIECKSDTQPSEGIKTLYVKGNCSFGGIEIK